MENLDNKQLELWKQLNENNTLQEVQKYIKEVIEIRGFATKENSRYIKSEEILYEIRKIQQDAVLRESIESNLTRERGQQNAKEFLQTEEGGKQFARFQFSQDKYSNRETTMPILEDSIDQIIYIY